MSDTLFSTLENRLIHCQKCPRLTAWREEIGLVKRKAYRNEIYWAKPVPGFGDPKAKILVIGLAPGAHGSNRTGRMFTGDDSGKFLYPALWRAGFANQPNGFDIEDGLSLSQVWITAVCRCVPPDNKPAREEISNCREYLLEEIHLLQNIQGVVALGKIAYEEAVRIFQISAEEVPVFSHGCLIKRTDAHPWILASYHPSRQNTQTGRLTAGMFDDIWKKADKLLF